MRDLLLGMRLAATGSRGGLIMTAVGVGLGMMVLLVASSVPHMVRAVNDRQLARTSDEGAVAAKAGPDTTLVSNADTSFRGDAIFGLMLEPEGPRAPAPPGVRTAPGPGEMVVSPDLGELLNSPAGKLLRQRLDGPIVGTIGDAGLTGPRELAYYVGGNVDPRLGHRVTGFGTVRRDDPLMPFFTFVLTVGVVVLLLPVGVFVGTAARFGSEQRDRRLAALRLIGADRAQAVRIAAGESLLGALGGLALGGALFGLMRPQLERLHIADLSVFASDVRPDVALVALLTVLVPAAAVTASTIALRRVVVEPLGVTRRGAAPRRRLWWRLVPLVAGGMLLAEMGGGLVTGTGVGTVQVGAGVALVLVGITAVLPWVVDTAVRRAGGGGLAWQLAARRLQMDGGTAARAVSGVAVAVAGAIALQSVLTAGERVASIPTFAGPARSDAEVRLPAGVGTREGLVSALAATPGVSNPRVTELVYVRNHSSSLRVGDCAALRERAMIGACADGDVFATAAFKPGSRLRIDPGGTYTVPDGVRRVAPRVSPYSTPDAGLLLTPTAARGLRGGEVAALADLNGRDAFERLQNAVYAISPLGDVFRTNVVRQFSAYRTIKNGLFAGALLVLILIGASLLVAGLEQLRERRPVLAALSAFGTPWSVLARSILWQTAVPVALGLSVSVIVGLGLGALLLAIGSQPMVVDWSAVAAMAAAGAGVIGIVTLLSLSPAARLMRPDGLRTE